MEIIVTSPQDFAQKSADLVAQKIIELQSNLARNLNMVLATGNTMVDFLDCLSKKNIDWSKINFFHLDEYKGLSIDHPSSFAYFLRQNLFSKINIPAENLNFINGAHPNLSDYINKLNTLGGADITMLGVGMDGHLAFNEPPLYSNFSGRMGEVKLVQSTIDANQFDYPEIVQNPFAFSMGMADIFESKNIFFLAKGIKKADIIDKSINGPIDESVPASMLQKHPSVTAILDNDAASLLVNL